MKNIKALILRTAGTNCDQETQYACTLANMETHLLHINQLIENTHLLDSYQFLVIPGGFSYGDDVGAGKLFANELKYRLADALSRFIEQEKLVLGICNGFQVLVSIGLLPDIKSIRDKNDVQSDFEQSATLHWNTSYKFEARWVNLKVPETNNSIFLRDIKKIMLPVAHAEGRFIVINDETLEALKSKGRISLQYITPEGDVPSYPDNPNASVADIAGINDSTGRVLGLMPHPERFLHYYNHPSWTRLNNKGFGEGLKLFQNAYNFFQ